MQDKWPPKYFKLAFEKLRHKHTLNKAKSQPNQTNFLRIGASKCKHWPVTHKIYQSSSFYSNIFIFSYIQLIFTFYLKLFDTILLRGKEGNICRYPFWQHILFRCPIRSFFGLVGCRVHVTPPSQVFVCRWQELHLMPLSHPICNQPHPR